MDLTANLESLKDFLLAHQFSAHFVKKKLLKHNIFKNNMTFPKKLWKSSKTSSKPYKSTIPMLNPASPNHFLSKKVLKINFRALQHLPVTHKKLHCSVNNCTIFPYTRKTTTHTHKKSCPSSNPKYSHHMVVKHIIISKNSCGTPFLIVKNT